MKERPNPLDELETGWMDDIKNERTKFSRKTTNRLTNKLIVDQSLKKAHPVSIRIPTVDLEAIQLKAAKAGIPYQTLIKSVLHKFATDSLEM